MASITLVFTSNADGTLSIVGSAANSSSGMNMTVSAPKDEGQGQWRRQLADFIIGKLFP